MYLPMSSLQGQSCDNFSPPECGLLICMLPRWQPTSPLKDLYHFSALRLLDFAELRAGRDCGKLSIAALQQPCKAIRLYTSESESYLESQGRAIDKKPAVFRAEGLCSQVLRFCYWTFRAGKVVQAYKRMETLLLHFNL